MFQPFLFYYKFTDSAQSFIIYGGQMINSFCKYGYVNGIVG